MARIADSALRAAAPLRVANASIFIGTIAAIVALIALLLPLDLFLAQIDSNASAAHAASEYGDGLALLRQGRASDAADHLRNAVTIDRASVPYTLAFAEAQLDEGRTADAESTLNTLLDRAGNEGAVNLTMAHVMIAENKVDDAKAYFHRAIFGRWGADSLARRNQARFELIDLLVKHGATRELLAELLPLEEVPPDSAVLRRRLGNLFILAGSPVRAANLFRDAVHRDPSDAEAYNGMGEAELVLGNFRTARADFAEAARLEPNNGRIADRLALADSVLAMDPLARGIASRDRLSRSRSLLARVVSAAESCGVSGSAVDSARAILAPAPAKRGARPARLDPDAEIERLTESATDVWSGRPPNCAVTSRDEALRIVMSRVTQSQ